MQIWEKKLHLLKLAEKYDYVFQWALENLGLFWLGINGQNVFQREINIYISCLRSCKSQRCSIYKIATNYYKSRQKYCVNFKVGSGAVLMLITLNEWYTYIYDTIRITEKWWLEKYEYKIHRDDLIGLSYLVKHIQKCGKHYFFYEILNSFWHYKNEIQKTKWDILTFFFYYYYKHSAERNMIDFYETVYSNTKGLSLLIFFNSIIDLDLVEILLFIWSSCFHLTQIGLIQLCVR